MSDQTCPDCVELFKVHRPTNWNLCLVLAATFFLIGIGLQMHNHKSNSSIMLFVVSFLCIACNAIIHFIRCSRFLISVDSAGLVHLHRRNKPVLDAQLVLEVTAGAIRRRCKLYCRYTNYWKVSANNQYLFFTDPEGEIFSVRYCTKPHHAATGYVSNPKKHISNVLRLIKQVAYVAAIGRLALDHINAETQDVPAVAGSISANQG